MPLKIAINAFPRSGPIHESVITMDLAGFILSWNLGAEKLFATPPLRRWGKTSCSFVWIWRRRRFTIAWSLSRKWRSWNGSSSTQEKNGEVFWASLSLSTLVDENDHPIGLIGYLSDITQRKCAEEKINHLAYYDALTDFPNRTLFKKLVDTAIQRGQRNDDAVSVLFIDLNRFKAHQWSPRACDWWSIIEASCGSLQSCFARAGCNRAIGKWWICRRRDWCETPLRCRFGRTEIVDQFRRRFLVGGHELRLGASIGISMFPKRWTRRRRAFAKADIAMFRAKRLIEKSAGDYARFWCCDESVDCRAHAVGVKSA